MKLQAGNLFNGISEPGTEEEITVLLTTRRVQIERIVSHAHASPPGFWYDQDWDEWVLVLSGAAGLQIAGEADVRHLRAGDYVFIPAHCRHRVEWTQADEPTIWLAVHVRQTRYDWA